MDDSNRVLAISVPPRLLPSTNGCFRVVHFSKSDDWKNQFFVEKKGFHLAASMPLSNVHSGLKSPHPLTLLKTTSAEGTCTTRTTPPGGSVKHFAAMLTAKSQSNTKSPETTLVRGSVETMGCELSILNSGAGMVTSHQPRTNTNNQKPLVLDQIDELTNSCAICFVRLFQQLHP
jgi:hypothetical protein